MFIIIYPFIFPNFCYKGISIDLTLSRIILIPVNIPLRLFRRVRFIDFSYCDNFHFIGSVALELQHDRPAAPPQATQSSNSLQQAPSGAQLLELPQGKYKCLIIR